MCGQGDLVRAIRPLREDRAGSRVVHDDPLGQARQFHSEIQCGGVAHVVAVRFEGRSEHCHRGPSQVVAQEFPSRADDTGSHSVIHLVHLGEEGQGIADAELVGPSPESANVLG